MLTTRPYGNNNIVKIYIWLNDWDGEFENVLENVWLRVHPFFVEYTGPKSKSYSLYYCFFLCELLSIMNVMYVYIQISVYEYIHILYLNDICVTNGWMNTFCLSYDQMLFLWILLLIPLITLIKPPAGWLSTSRFRMSSFSPVMSFNPV